MRTYLPSLPTPWLPPSPTENQAAAGLSCTHSNVRRASFSDFGDTGACSTLSFNGLNGVVGSNQWDAADGNWDPSDPIGECAANEFVSGVAQLTGTTDALLCCPANVTHQSCEVATIGGPLPGVDWDAWYGKAQCPNPNEYVAGVSVNPSTGGPHSILCCQP